MADTTSRAWRFRVVKRMRNLQGAWFDFGTAQTFLVEVDAHTYAQEFARTQGAAGVHGARIDVRKRQGDTTITSYKSDAHVAQGASA